ncbi:MAG: serine/threonine-protein kinase [Rhodothermales bacterium]
MDKDTPMDRDRWDRLKLIFDEAYDKSAGERTEYIRQACGDDVELLADIQSLLAEEDSVHSMLDGVALDASEALTSLSREGTQIGPYILVRKLGIGGMGEVYLAERSDGQFEHQVALKLIRGGIHSEHILARFRSERQILARLEHPNIARLLDGGLTDEGQPYFVLEYVDGKPIDEFANSHELRIDDRLALFDQVCRAVTYAHANLVVHRDLKPSNILVTEDGRVKLVDFGIAKVLSEEDDGLSITRTGAVVMTPAYASPEQARGEPIGTSSDIYSLGVVLYELLTGLRPYEVDSSNPVSAARVICEATPERPSSAVTHATGSATTTHGSDTGRLRRLLSGDLDVICLKALRKEPARRYMTSDELGEDLRRFLSGRPIEARSESVSYRMGKFVKRHRWGAALSSFALILITSLTVFYTTRLAEERDRAQVEAEKARQVADFLKQVFSVSNPSQNPGETLTAREVLDQGAARLEEDLADQPEVLADMLEVLADVYAGLGMYNEDVSFSSKALAIRQKLFQPPSREIAMSLKSVGNAYRNAGNLAKADSLNMLSVAMWDQLPPGVDLAIALNDAGLTAAYAGDPLRADSLLTRSIELRKKLTGADNLELGAAYNNLSLVKKSEGKYAEADTLLGEVIRLLRLSDNDERPHLSIALKNRADLQRTLGNFQRAESLFDESIAMSRALYDPGHPAIGVALKNYGRLLIEMKEFDKARTAITEAYRILDGALGPEHPNTISALSRLSDLYLELGDFAVADSLRQITLAKNREQVGPVHPRIAEDLTSMANSYLKQGRYEEALGVEKEAKDMLVKIHGAVHPDVAKILYLQGETMLGLGRKQEAKQLLEEALAMQVRVLGEDHPDVAETRAALEKL